MGGWGALGPLTFVTVKIVQCKKSLLNACAMVSLCMSIATYNSDKQHFKSISGKPSGGMLSVGLS